MTYLDWRRKIYSPLALCSKEIVCGTSIIVQERIIRFNVCYCINKYGKGIVAMVLAHTARHRRYVINDDGINAWADSVSRIGLPEEYINKKRDFNELLLHCNDKTLVALCNAYISYTREKEIAYA